MDIETLFKIAGFVLTIRAVDYILDKNEKLPKNPPVDKLLELIDFVGRDHQVVCFGDTDHADPAIKSLLLSPALARGMAEQGFGSIFFEHPEHYQQLYDDLFLRKISKEKFITKLLSKGGISDWTGRKINRHNAAFLADIISDSGLRVYAIDHRLRHEFTAEALSITFSTMLFPLGILNLLFKACCSRSSLGRRIHCFIFSFPVMFSERFLKVATDDVLPAQKISEEIRDSASKLFAVVYGAGHFCGEAERYGASGMKSELEGHGLRTAVINIHSREPEKFYQQFEKAPYFQPPTADFVIFPKEGRPQVIFHDAAKEIAFRSHCAKGRGNLRVGKEFFAAPNNS